MATTDCTLIDSTFGPWAQGCRGGLDFTVLFEEAILGILPSCIFSILALLRIMQLRRRTLEASNISFLSRRVLATKQATIILLALTRFAALLVWILEKRGPKTKVSDAYLFFSFLELAFLLALSYHEHTFSIAPSLLIGLYLFLTLSFDCVRVRTLWLMQTHTLLAAIYSTSLLVKLCLIILESRRNDLQRNIDAGKTLEELSGPYGRALFLWVLVILKNGHSRLLTLSDTFAVRDRRISEGLCTQFREEWANQFARDGESASILLHVLAKSILTQVLSPVIPRVAMVAVTIAQPLLIQRLLIFMDTTKHNSSMSVGYALLGAFACLYGVTAVVNAWYAHAVNRLRMELRNQLIDTIYRKSLRLHVGIIDGGNISTLANIDVQRIMDGALVLHETWACAATVGIAMYLLYKQLSYAFIAPLVFTIVCILLTALCINAMIGRQTAWLEATEKRIGATLQAISSIKEIKMLGFTTPFFQLLTSLREVEILRGRKFRRFLSLVVVTSAASSQVAILAAYGVYAIILKAKGAAPLNTTTLFTSLAILQVATNPLLVLIQGIPEVASTIACLTRIQTFLKLPECSKSTVIVDDASQSRLVSEKSEQEISITGVSSGAPHQQQPEILSAEEKPCIARISEADFSWIKSESAGILKEISFDIHYSEFIAIVGATGSGKSTLLHSVLGETYTQKGLVSFTGTPKIAFCQQKPWLLNDSIQSNILAGKPYLKSWYEEVLAACALSQDLSTLENGDMTLVGPEGSLLSGGQKQRVALARALYPRPDLFLFDDIFSGLDKATEQHIFTALLGPNGLITELGSAVVLVTHSVKWLPHADTILVLQDSKIVEHGSFEQLRFAGGYIQSLEIQEEESQKEKQSLEKFKITKEAAYEAEEAKAAPIGPGDLSVYWYYIKTLGIRSACVFFILAAITAADRSYGNVWLKNWAASGQSDKTAYYISVFTALVIAGLLSLYALCYLYFDLLLSRTSLHLYVRQLDALMKFIQDVMLVDDEIPMAFINTTTSFFGVIGETVIILFSSKYLSASLPVLIGILYTTQRFYLKTSRQLRLMDISSQAPLSAHIAETVQGVITIRASGRITEFIEVNRVKLEVSQNAMYSLLSVQVWLKLVLDWTVAGLAVLVVGIAIGVKSKQDLGFLGLALVNLISLSSSFKYLITFWVTLETAIGAVSRIRSFTDDTEPEESLGLPVPPEHWPIHGRINFDRVTASYKLATEPVLKDLSFGIEPHEKIAICGRTGSGKSSLLATILRVLEIDKGTVKVDDIDITGLSREALRSRFTFLPQEPLFFPGSIRHNLETWTAINDQRIEEVLQKVDLWQLVVELGGLGTELDPDAMFSAGQRQLFCLARALLKDSAVVLLDEATSNIDHASDAIVQEVVRKELRDKTIIAVAHRLNTILDFDKVLVMDKGSLIECGNPKVLLQQDNSAFTDLWNSKSASDT